MSTDYRMIAGAIMAKKRADNDARILAIIGTPTDDPTAINRSLAADGKQDRRGRGSKPPIGDTSIKRDRLDIESAKVDKTKRLTAADRIGAAIDPLTGFTADLPNPN